jgi:uncharacterized membrane protein HdeD (DUF308 family)
MALVCCPACQERTSKEAESCPHCGHPVRRAARAKSQRREWGALLLGGALMIIGLFLCCSYGYTGLVGFNGAALGGLLLIGGLLLAVAGRIREGVMQ